MPSLVRRPRSRPNITLIDAGRVTSDPPAPHTDRHDLEGQRQQRRLGGLGGGSLQQRTGAPTCEFYNLSSALPPTCCCFLFFLL
jgi:hypothetical protein